MELATLKVNIYNRVFHLRRKNTIREKVQYDSLINTNEIMNYQLKIEIMSLWIKWQKWRQIYEFSQLVSSWSLVEIDTSSYRVITNHTIVEYGFRTNTEVIRIYTTFIVFLTVFVRQPFVFDNRVITLGFNTIHNKFPSTSDLWRRGERGLWVH